MFLAIKASITLIKVSPTAVGFTKPSSLEHNIGTIWGGTTKTKISALFVASMTSGIAI